jgi:hypothetical protein
MGIETWVQISGMLSMREEFTQSTIHKPVVGLSLGAAGAGSWPKGSEVLICSLEPYIGV